MSDLVKRLRAPANWLRQTGGEGWKDAVNHYDRSPYEAADRIEELERHLGGLLAIIHRDGGHHTCDVGLSQSINDAHKIWAGLVDARREALEEAAAVAKRSWLTSPYRDADAVLMHAVCTHAAAAIRALMEKEDE